MRILIVDDEPLARGRLCRLLQRLRPDAELREAGGGEQALRELADFAADLLLLDIRMPGMDGIEVAARIDALPQPPAIVFCTAYDQYALEALRHQAVAYLLKPVREAELGQALARAGRVNKVQIASLLGEPEQTSGRSLVTSQSHRGIESLPLAQVRCFLAEQKYVTACAPQQELLIPDTLKDLEQEFDGAFVRVHRSALVALQHVVALRKDDSQGWCVELDAVAHRPQVSRRHLTEFKRRLQQR